MLDPSINSRKIEQKLNELCSIKKKKKKNARLHKTMHKNKHKNTEKDLKKCAPQKN